MNLQAAIDLHCVVVKQGSQYCVKSEDGKNLGCSPSKGGAKKRLAQVEYFKHMKGGGVGSGRKKGSSKKKWSRMSEEERRQAAFHDPRQMKLPLKAGGPGSGRHQEVINNIQELSRKAKYSEGEENIKHRQQLSEAIKQAEKEGINWRRTGRLDPMSKIAKAQPGRLKGYK